MAAPDIAVPILPRPPRAPLYGGSDNLTVVLAGESIMASLGTQVATELTARGYPATVYNEAIGGTGVGGLFAPNYFDWLPAFDAILASRQPDLVCWQDIGTSGSLDLEPFVTRAGIIIAKAHAAGAAVAWARSPAVDVAANQAYYDSVLAAADDLPADDHPDVHHYLTPYHRWVGTALTDQGIETIRSDNLHLAAAGQRIYTRVLVNAIARFWA